MQECELKIVSNLERLPIEHNLICDAVYLRELILICLEKVACHAMINGARSALPRSQQQVPTVSVW